MSSKGVALVTGAGQGIGRAIALRLADDGFDVAVNDIQDTLDTLTKEIIAKGRRASAVVADVSVQDQVKSMIERVVAELGGLDVMVANAGAVIWNSMTNTTVEEWDRIFAINVRGTFLCYKYAAQQMIAQGRGGRIIGACSVAGKKGQPMIGAYSSTKFAIRGLTQAAASELGQHRITVNAYAPGPIDTPLLRALDEDSGKGADGTTDRFIIAAQKKSILGRIGEPSDIANLVSYIASREAHHLTGQSIVCDGGIHFD